MMKFAQKHTRDYVGMKHHICDTREDVNIGNINSERNSQAHSFDNSISLYGPFEDAESIGLRRSNVIKETKGQSGSLSSSARSLYEDAKVIGLFSMKI